MDMVDSAELLDQARLVGSIIFYLIGMLPHWFLPLDSFS